MAVPKKRTSKTRKRKRRTHKKLSAPSLVECSNCHEKILPHHVCPECGHYDGKKVSGN
ncbi:50S ribosomal protein L32 [Halanaerobium saccharolyticum]|jgi:large subunit ribosomal protein L32|uniref:Large ribosomal subunit protein bL32 n=1 Tax=Halanaerobium saccharolyticum TaxID=43595 RepID=A0A2T5RKA7_9FIRM|nr:MULTISPECIES: 50S ribosomal protein L32 [Halanaerobium]PTV99324.1 LSU ribosomal protein L32P [Halanaerobium saccharolyticum]PUU94351.1 MAG: large subunit ribosomal protein L32 [Halanaerobium sp.]PUU95215.1 MAG: large subunit ribosomal protein L32 [Halanaerobium sp.]TDP90682.1 LSU ribosomal protein L32P [Halanaerobium saccharolyticum]